MRISALLVCLTGLTFTTSLAATVPARDSRIVEVTLFLDRAEVVRDGRADLPAGASSVEFLGIPFDVDPDSFRVSAEGVPAVLGTVEIRERADEPAESPELVAAREEVRRLEQEIALIGEADRVANELRSFLNAIKATTAEKASAALGAGSPNPAAISDVYNLLESKLTSLAKSGLDRQRALERFQKELEIARAKLASVAPAAGIRSRAVTVEVETRKAGALSLRLAYVVRGASWRPSYRVALDAATGEVNLVSEAVVRQRTGEDWTDVALRLSTAAPARGVMPPQLTSLLLRPQDEVSVTAGFADAAAAPPALRLQNPNSIEEMEGMPLEKREESAVRESTIVRSAYNVTFEVPGKADVPADGSEHRVVLRQETLRGKIVHRTVPALNPSAYLTAIMNAPGGYPLLAGPVRVHAGGAFLGSFYLPETGPDAELTLPFGVDNRIRVERTPLPRESGREGLTGRTRQISYAFKTTVENLRDQPTELILEDRIPVSEDERIKVEMSKTTSPGFKESEHRPGVLLWTLTLAPREKREILLGYTVSHPRDLYVPALE